MDVHASLEAPCAADVLFRLVDDLATYPEWIDLVHRVQVAESVAVAESAWVVELRARVGPLARSKQLRMVRREHDPIARRVVFERSEADGRRHSPWVLSAEVAPHSEGSALQMHLHYGGGLWTGGLLERTLAEQITNGRARLAMLATATH